MTKMITKQHAKEYLTKQGISWQVFESMCGKSEYYSKDLITKFAE